MKRLLALCALLLGWPLTPGDASANPGPWDYHDPGDLKPNSGQGKVEWKVFAPNMRFPIENGPAFANSQVYMNGGSQGGGGAQCDAVNYSYPWRDNYCEIRSWSMPLCPAGQGHQGQDIRPATCEKLVHKQVATVDGTVTNVGTYSVYVTAPDGTRYDSLHGQNEAVSSGQSVSKGQLLNYVSNDMGGTPTTIHLHFNIKQDVAGVGYVYVSPYMSLVQAYEDLMGFGNEVPGGSLDASDCTSIRGWAQDPDTPTDPIDVHVYFNGPASDPAATGIAVKADQYRMDLCDALGSCEHAFEVEVPRSLRDGASHPVHVYGIDSEGGDNAEVSASPQSFTCPAPAIPAGVRRHVANPEVLAAWNFSPFWDQLQVDNATLNAIDEWEAMPGAPLLIQSDAEPGKIYLVDAGYRRHVPTPEVAAAWRFDLASAETWAETDVQSIPEGTPVRTEPFLLKGEGPEVYVIDDMQCPPDSPDPLCGAGGTGGGDDSGTTGASSASGGNSGGDSGGTAGGATGGVELPPGYGLDDDGGGCGCSSQGGRGLTLALLPLLALARRRRR